MKARDRESKQFLRPCFHQYCSKSGVTTLTVQPSAREKRSGRIWRKTVRKSSGSGEAGKLSKQLKLEGGENECVNENGVK